MKKVLAVISVLSLVAVLFTACTNNFDTVLSNNNQQEQSQNDTGVAENEESNSEKVLIENSNNSSEENSNGQVNESRKDSGRYQGQADSNFIEIKISGVPDDKATKVFMLSEELKAKFEQLKLKKDENIKFEYFQNKNEQMVITEIEKI